MATLYVCNGIAVFADFAVLVSHIFLKIVLINITTSFLLPIGLDKTCSLLVGWFEFIAEFLLVNMKWLVVCDWLHHHCSCSPPLFSSSRSLVTEAATTDKEYKFQNLEVIFTEMV